MAQNQALAIPKILQSVLKHADLGSLFNCLSVDRLWFSEASRLLWDRMIYRKDLNLIEDACRAQYYASLTRGLTITYNDEGDKHMLEFPNLKHLYVIANPKSPLWRTSYLVPSLTKFNLIGRPADDKVLDELLSKCPNLTEIMVSNLQATPAALERFFSKCLASSLTCLNDSFECLSPNVFLQAASNKHLAELRIPMVSTIAVEKVALCVDDPFKNLVKFTHNREISGPQARKLLAIMPRLEELRLPSVEQVEPTLVAIIDTVPPLTSLYVHGEESPPTSKTLISLARKIPHLRCVEIMVRDITEFSDVDDKCASEFTGICKDLEILFFNFSHRIGCSGVGSIGLNCREMQHLGWNSEHTYDINDDDGVTYFDEYLYSDQATPLFPNLISLTPMVYLYELTRAAVARHFPIIYHRDPDLFRRQ